MNRGRLIFGGLVAVILLGLYVYATIVAIMAARCLGQPPCQLYTKDLNEGIITVLNLIGGLVSALVVVELAVTKPGEAPAARLLEGSSAADKAQTVVKVVSTIYILVWMICGLSSLIVGYLQYPNVVPALTAGAKSWLGLAVASAYSYLGVKQGGGGGGGQRVERHPGKRSSK